METGVPFTFTGSIQPLRWPVTANDNDKLIVVTAVERPRSFLVIVAKDRYVPFVRYFEPVGCLASLLSGKLRAQIDRCDDDSVGIVTLKAVRGFASRTTANIHGQRFSRVRSSRCSFCRRTRLAARVFCFRSLCASCELRG